MYLWKLIAQATARRPLKPMLPITILVDQGFPSPIHPQLRDISGMWDLGGMCTVRRTLIGPDFVVK